MGMADGGDGSGLVDLCTQCREYGEIFRTYVRGLTKGDYNAWSGIGIMLDVILESDTDPELTSAIASVCDGCTHDIGVYSRRGQLRELKEMWEKIDSELSGMPHEDATSYLRENSRYAVISAALRILDTF
jgi:hypothetical protein